MVAVAVVLDPRKTAVTPEPVIVNDGDAMTVRGTESVVVTDDVEADEAATATAYAPGVVWVVVFTWTWAVTGAVPFNVTDGGTEHVGRLCGLEIDVLTEQERFTSPASPPDGITVMIDVSPAVAPADTLSGPLFITARDGEAADVTIIWKVPVKLIPSDVLSEP
jgi:hypothetical protein